MKKIISIFLVLIMCISYSVAFAQYTPTGKDITVTYNGENVDFGTAKAQNIGGFTMVPMRAVFELAGCEVSYNEKKKQVVAKKENYELLLTIDSKEATVTKDGVTLRKQLDIAPCIISDRTLVPVRFISESLGFTVNWNPSFKEVVIIDFETWEERIRKNTALSELVFTSLKNKETFGYIAQVTFDINTFLKLIGANKKVELKESQHKLTLKIDKNFDIYIKSETLIDVLGKTIGSKNLKSIEGKEIKISVSRLLMSELGIELSNEESLWESIKETLSSDEFIYSSTVKNLDDVISILECVKIKEKTSISALKNVSIPKNDKRVEIEEIFLMFE